MLHNSSGSFSVVFHLERKGLRHMKNFTFYNSVKVVFGANTINELSNLILSDERVMLTMGTGSIRKSRNPEKFYSMPLGSGELTAPVMMKLLMSALKGQNNFLKKPIAPHRWRPASLLLRIAKASPEPLLQGA
jgi:hypothetical protein